MKNLTNYSKTLLICALCALPKIYATHGMNFPGLSSISTAEGGTSIANIQDSLSSAYNPSGSIWLKDRNDLDLGLFNPNRKYSYVNSQGPKSQDSVTSGSKLFLMPRFGMKRQINDKSAFGFAIYANGGMNTNYPVNNGVFGNGPLGIDYGNVYIVPSISYLLTENNSFGFAPLFTIQRFKSHGIDNFDTASSGTSLHPGHVDSRGYDYSRGLGLRFGWSNEITPTLTLGAKYSTHTKQTRFKKYKGLFASSGRMNIPAEAGLGLKWQFSDAARFSFDMTKIYFGSVNAIGNKFVVPFNFGANRGTGFGWRNTMVYKAGLAFDVNDTWTLRFGSSYSKQPYLNDQMDLNILAPGVTKWHLMFGFTNNITKTSAVSLAYMRAFNAKIAGNSRLPSGNLGYVTHKMNQNLLQLTYSWL